MLSILRGRQAEEKEENEYSAIDHQLRTAIDAQYGIVREKKEDKAYPTGVAIIRNAQAAKEISDSTVDQNVIEQNNMLLRCLGRLRGIDHALKEMVGSSECSAAQKIALTELREKLKKDFEKLREEGVSPLPENKALTAKEKSEKFREKIRQMEESFNTETLCEVLHQANLDEGCSSKKDYEELLFHYRNLSSLLDPIPSLVTVTYDAVNKVLHRVTQDPIARKLPQQKQAIKREMRKTVLFPTGEEMTFQTSQKMAMQVANSYFAELAAMDDRMLGAQTRKTHLYGAKNAFFVTNELVFDVTDQEAHDNPLIRKGEIEAQSFARSAAPVYVGDGENDARIQKSMRDNMEQIRQFIITKLLSENPDLSPEDVKELKESVKMHYTCLVTDSPMEKQGFVLGHVVRATRDSAGGNMDYSYVPCNWDGTHRRLDLSGMVDAKDRPSVHPTPSNQAERYRRAAQVSVTIRGKKQERVFELVGCMSGQDRSETESEYASQEWVRQCYREKEFKLEKDPRKGDIVEATRAKGRNSAEINAHVVGGSPGCKNDSRGKTALIDYDNLYSPDTDKAMYLKSAKTNKENKVEKATLKRIIAKPSSVANMQYDAAYAKLQKVCEELKADNPMQQTGLTVLAEVEKIKGSVKPQDIGTLIRILREATHVVQGPESNPRTYANHVARLGVIAEKLNKKSRWKQLGSALLMLGGIALVAAGLLLAIPSGGSSLLATVLGAEALAVAAGFSLTTVVGIGGGVTFAGFVGTYFSNKMVKGQTRYGLEKESDLIKSVQKLQQKGIEANYITVPFPSTFFIECCDFFEESSPQRKMGEHGMPIAITPDMIKKSFENKEQVDEIKGDLSRLTWEIQGKKIQLRGIELKDYKADIQEKMPELKLTSEEVDMILSISTTIKGELMQGGAINAGPLLLSTGVTAPLLIESGSALGSFSISRAEDSSLIITSTWKPVSHHRFLDSDRTEYEEMKQNPFQYRETYTLRKEGPNWKLTLLPESSLHVHPEAWKHMLKQAKDQLNDQKRSSQPLTQKQLLSYVPLLMDKDFAKVFEKKLRNNPSLMPLEQCKLLEKLILQCHGPHHKQPEHILRVRYEINKIMQKAEAKQSSRMQHK